MDLDAWALSLYPEDLFELWHPMLSVQLSCYAPDKKHKDDPVFRDWIFAAEGGARIRIPAKYKTDLFKAIEAQGKVVLLNDHETAFIVGSHTITMRSFVAALMQVKCPVVRVTSYGMKEPLSDDDDFGSRSTFFDTGSGQQAPTFTRRGSGLGRDFGNPAHPMAIYNTFDLGVRHPADDLVLVRALKKTRGVTCFPILVPINDKHGTVHLDTKIGGNKYKVKLYSPIIHCIKAMSPPATLGKVDKIGVCVSRLASVQKYLAKLKKMAWSLFCGLRIEATVTAPTLREAIAQVNTTELLDPQAYLEPVDPEMRPYQMELKHVQRETYMDNCDNLISKAIATGLFRGTAQKKAPLILQQIVKDLVNSLGYFNGFRKMTAGLNPDAWWRVRAPSPPVPGCNETPRPGIIMGTDNSAFAKYTRPMLLKFFKLRRALIPCRKCEAGPNCYNLTGGATQFRITCTGCRDAVGVGDARIYFSALLEQGILRLTLGERTQIADVMPEAGLEDFAPVPARSITTPAQSTANQTRNQPRRQTKASALLAAQAQLQPQESISDDEESCSSHDEQETTDDNASQAVADDNASLDDDDNASLDDDDNASQEVTDSNASQEVADDSHDTDASEEDGHSQDERGSQGAYGSESDQDANSHHGDGQDSNHSQAFADPTESQGPASVEPSSGSLYQSLSSFLFAPAPPRPEGSQSQEARLLFAIEPALRMRTVQNVVIMDDEERAEVSRFIIGDGNCLFRAVSVRIFGSQEHHAQVRRDGVQYVRDHPKMLEGHLDEDEHADVSAYLDRMAQDAEYGDEIMLAALARAYNVRIIVHSGSTIEEGSGYYSEYPQSSNRPPISLFFASVPEHYELLIDTKLDGKRAVASNLCSNGHAGPSLDQSTGPNAQDWHIHDDCLSEDQDSDAFASEGSDGQGPNAFPDQELDQQDSDPFALQDSDDQESDELESDELESDELASQVSGDQESIAFVEHELIGQESNADRISHESYASIDQEPNDQESDEPAYEDSDGQESDAFATLESASQESVARQDAQATQYLDALDQLSPIESDDGHDLAFAASDGHDESRDLVADDVFVDRDSVSGPLRADSLRGNASADHDSRCRGSTAQGPVARHKNPAVGQAADQPAAGTASQPSQRRSQRPASQQSSQASQRVSSQRRIALHMNLVRGAGPMTDFFKARRATIPCQNPDCRSEPGSYTLSGTAKAFRIRCKHCRHTLTQKRGREYFAMLIHAGKLAPAE